MALLTYGTCSYNGYVFNEKTETVGVNIRPQYDASGRTVAYLVFSLTIRTIVTGAPTDAEMLRLRRLLMKAGGRFTYSGRGFGLFDINGAGQQRDVVWGPKPQECTFKPIGSDRACEVTWRVDVAIPDCAEARYTFYPMEFAFTVTFDLDKGYTTRTINGHLKVPQTRRSQEDRRLSDSVDYYRERMVPTRLPGFYRSFGPFVISQDKSRLDFTIIDTELRGPAPPPGVISVQASHEVSSGEKGLTAWMGMISADYTMTKHTNPMVAVRHFLGVLARDRILATADGVNRGRIGAGASTAIIPIKFSMSEPEIYGENRASFSLAYSFIQPLRQILNACSLWRPVPGSNWRLWDASLAGTVFNPRGYADLQFSIGDDRILDLCDNAPIVEDLKTGVGPGGSTRMCTGIPFGQDVLMTSCFPRPTPDSSWVQYENEVTLETDDGTSPIRQLATDIETSLTGANILPIPGGKPPNSVFNPIYYNTAYNSAAGAAIAHNLGMPSNVPSGIGVGPPGAYLPTTKWDTATRAPKAAYLYMRGRAARAGFPVPAPALQSVAGGRVVSANRLDRGEGFSQSVKAGIGSPLYVANWNFRYMLPDQPDSIPIPPNPILGKT